MSHSSFLWHFVTFLNGLCDIMNGRKKLTWLLLAFFARMLKSINFPLFQKVSQFRFSLDLVFALDSTLLLINDSHPLLTLPSLSFIKEMQWKKDFLVKKLNHTPVDILHAWLISIAFLGLFKTSRWLFDTIFKAVWKPQS